MVEIKTIQGRNVNKVLPQGIDLFVNGPNINAFESRIGPVLEHDGPVCTVYERPHERVLFSKVRNANPFFHFFESLWILDGRNDLRFLTYFLKKFEQYSDDGRTLHGAYGFRLRGVNHDQIEWVINHLRREPNSRRAVLSLFMPVHDHEDSKDIPCNLSAVFSIRRSRLYLTVYNRSNDMVWGAYGANAVQFSMLQEVIASLLGTEVGSYAQISNNFHVYAEEETWQRLVFDYHKNKHWNHLDLYTHPWHHVHRPVSAYPIFGGMNASRINLPTWDSNLQAFLMQCDGAIDSGAHPIEWTKYDMPFFEHVAKPLFNAFVSYKNNDLDTAIGWSHQCLAMDWRAACVDWLERVKIKRQSGEGVIV